MSLFRDSGNFDVEGVTSINACYGSTNALFNTFNWIESSSWDGRLGIVISADIAVYPKGNARPTGGAGAIGFLIGRGAPIVIEPVRASYVDHQYDFYKPNPLNEYPIVDGHASVGIYMHAMISCWHTYKEKHSTRYPTLPLPAYSDFAYFCFHTPFSKMV